MIPRFSLIRIIALMTIGTSLAWGVSLATAATANHELVSVSGPSSASRGSTISLTYKVKNRGPQLSTSSTVKFYLCTSLPAVSTCQINTHGPGPIVVNQTVTKVNSTFTVPAAQALGTNYVIAVCGFGDTDPDWSNNTNSYAIVISE